MHRKKRKLIETIETIDGHKLEWFKSSDGYSVKVNGKVVAIGDTKKETNLNLIFNLIRNSKYGLT